MILRATRPARPLNPAARAGKAGIAAWVAASFGAHALVVAALIAWDRAPDHPPVPYVPVEIVVEQPRVAEAVAKAEQSIPRSATPSPHAPEMSTARLEQPTDQSSVIPAERRLANIETPLNPNCNKPPCAGPGSRTSAQRGVSGMTSNVVHKSEASQPNRTKAISITQQPPPLSDRAAPAAMPPVPRSRPDAPPIFVALPKQNMESSGVDVPRKPPKSPIVSAAAPTVSSPDKPAGVISTDPGPEKRAIPVMTKATAGVSRPPAVDGGAVNAPPVYPYLARERGWEGRVVLRVAVDAAGRARDVTVEKGSGRAVLDRAATDAVRKWRFHPASRAGEAVAGVVKVPISFRLRNE